ncbi:bacillithiol biosynthesis cysteine-adding enzyme BshC [Paenibacillus aurantius]|uniref:Putative cysteine ligase BshC n=1 Tax=Paenibacillus aurantius TaxID=2918900 RepID=A0AA96LGJ2_9BACL|nr:bacillithiol biosynthesis cysteine-adding enzyme BshC [Paenibacillus aurantius]WNQ13507.1 bacillithiol biosynthesis cysteine-adding enzyme BshC [Paenibacillus aurantius]
MKLEITNGKSTQEITEHYLRDFERVRSLYEYNPRQPEDWERRARRLNERVVPDGHRDRLADAMLAYNSLLSNDDKALANIALLREPETLVVVGGQQAGLFTGPLLVIYKAITILQAAAKASAELNRPVVPVFWIAGEDHDWDEVNHIYYLSQKQDVERIKLDQPEGTRTSVSRIRIADWEEMVGQLEESLLPTEFKPDLMAKLREFAASSGTLSDYFGRIMAWLFGESGLVLMDSDDPAIRRVESEMFIRFLENQEELASAYRNGREQVESLGYKPQAEVYEENANLFLYDDDGERFLLQRDGGGFTDKKKERRFTKEQLLELARTAPERFSNNVMTRPIMQDFLFPVLAAVLGPGEIAYWGLLKDGFRTLGMEMPLLLPRSEFTLIEGTVKKHMDKFGLTSEVVAERFGEFKANWLKEQDTLNLDERFAEVKEKFRGLYNPLLEAVGAINPGMAKLGDTNYLKIMEQIEFFEARAKGANESQFEASLRQLDRIQLSLYPLGKPQERVYNVFAYLNRYGHWWLKELAEQAPAGDGLHRLVYL